MTITVEFVALNTNDGLDRLVESILNAKGLHHRGATAKEMINSEKKKVTCLTINGICSLDKDIPFLSNLFRSIIKEEDLLCYLSAISLTHEDNDVMFLSSRYTPSPSLNSVFLKKINLDDVPDKYCCSLSMSIMDTPCFDVRYPQYKFEYNFLLHSLRLCDRPRHPQTNVPMLPGQISIDYALRGEINAYVYGCKDCYDSMQKTLLLKKFSNAINLNQALRRALSVSTTELKDVDIDVATLLRTDKLIYSPGGTYNEQKKTYELCS